MILTNQTSMQHKKGQTGRFSSFFYVFANIELEANRKNYIIHPYKNPKSPPPPNPPLFSLLFF